MRERTWRGKVAGAKADLEELLDGENYLMNEDERLEKEAEEIIRWSDQLDFDKYMDDWFFKSTIFVNFGM